MASAPASAVRPARWRSISPTASAPTKCICISPSLSRSEMKHRLLILLFFLLAASGSGIAWLDFSASGLAALARLAAVATDGRLHLVAPGGSLLGGELVVERLAWTEPELAITVSGLRLVWSPSDLRHGRLAIASAAAARVQGRRCQQRPGGSAAGQPAAAARGRRRKAADCAVGHWPATDLRSGRGPLCRRRRCPPPRAAARPGRQDAD